MLVVSNKGLELTGEVWPKVGGVHHNIRMVIWLNYKNALAQ